jgi:hypothetical protein
MKLDLTLLDKLVHEYCVYRGIVEGSSHVLSGKWMNLYYMLQDIFCLLQIRNFVVLYC